jgi:hypothetical protein
MVIKKSKRIVNSNSKRIVNSTTLVLYSDLVKYQIYVELLPINNI